MPWCRSQIANGLTQNYQILSSLFYHLVGMFHRKSAPEAFEETVGAWLSQREFIADKKP